jgi:hypothetical protein
MRVGTEERLAGLQLLVRPSQCVRCPMTSNLSDWQMVGLRINANEEGEVRVTFQSEDVTQLGEPPRTIDETNSTRQHAVRGGHNLVLRSKNLCLIPARNLHARRVPTICSAKQPSYFNISAATTPSLTFVTGPVMRMA